MTGTRTLGRLSLADVGTADTAVAPEEWRARERCEALPLLTQQWHTLLTQQWHTRHRALRCAGEARLELARWPLG
jgi:hypothetical protein